jgi:uracil-DNA glycosylase
MMLINNDWESLFQEEFSKTYMKELWAYLEEEYATEVVYPPKSELFRAFQLAPYKEVKVVILGQDPYHGPNQANGLSFSVNPGIPLPPSLRNIFKELASDLKLPMFKTGDLSSWAVQGVLLLNTTLSVRSGAPMSHAKKGWEIFTDRILMALNDRKEPLVFILWGKHAQSKKPLISNERHLILESVHPSPLSARRGFFGSQPFSKSNDFLAERAISWQLTSQSPV